jgi:hypothetical protein
MKRKKCNYVVLTTIVHKMNKAFAKVSIQLSLYLSGLPKSTKNDIIFVWPKQKGKRHVKAH